MNRVLKVVLIIAVLGSTIYGVTQLFSPDLKQEGVKAAKQMSNISSLKRFFTINKKLHEYAEQDLVSKILEIKLENGHVGKQRQYSDFYNKRWIKSLLIYMYDDLKIDVQQVTSYLELSLIYLKRKDFFRKSSFKRHGEGPKFSKEIRIKYEELKLEYLSACEKLLGSGIFDSIVSFRNKYNSVIKNELKNNYIDFNITVEI